MDAEPVSRKERERLEWDKERLAGKPAHELTPWEQQRLAEIEWEEEWERRELVSGEQEEIEQIGGDIDELRRWFDAVGERKERHPSKYAALLQRERERQDREQRRIERKRRERELRERERAEIAAFDDDVDGLRCWFDTDPERQKRHPSAYAPLVQREREQRLKESEQARIAAFGDDLNGLRQWFDTFKVRPKRHPSEYSALLQREQEREQEQQARQKRERAEIAAFGGDIDGLRRWFNMYRNRPIRHPSEYAALIRREQEQQDGLQDPIERPQRSLLSRIFRR